MHGWQYRAHFHLEPEFFDIFHHMPRRDPWEVCLVALQYRVYGAGVYVVDESEVMPTETYSNLRGKSTLAAEIYRNLHSIAFAH